MSVEESRIQRDGTTIVDYRGFEVLHPPENQTKVIMGASVGLTNRKRSFDQRGCLGQFSAIERCNPGKMKRIPVSGVDG